MNTIGSFECVCEEGFELEEDMMSCAGNFLVVILILGGQHHETIILV